MSTTATKTAKQIIDSLAFLTKDQKNYIMTNKISHLPMSLEITEDKHKFISITNFSHIEQIEISADDFRIWEHFSMMADLKTALNFWTYIAEGKKLSMTLFEKQKNVSAKKIPTADGFMQWLNELTPEQKQHLKAEILRWDTENLMQNLTPYLTSYQMNDGDKFKTGDYILYFDTLQNASFYGRIFQAEKNGLIMVNTADYHIIADNRMQLDHIAGEKIPVHFKKPIDQIFSDYSETGDEFRDKFFAKLEKSHASKEKADKKANEAYEKKFTASILKASKSGFLPLGDGKNKEKYLYEGKYSTITQLKNTFLDIATLEAMGSDFLRAKNLETSQAFDDLIKRELKSPTEIEEFLKEANQYDWSADQKKAINGKIKADKEAIKTALKSAENKPAETAPADQPATGQKPAGKAILAKTTGKTGRGNKKAEKPADNKPETENKPDQPKG